MNLVSRFIIAVTSLSMSFFASSALITISDGQLAADNQVLNFESATTGDITGTESFFADAGVQQVAFLGTSFSNLDTLDLGTDGNALAASNNGLKIVDINDPIDHIIQEGGFAFSLITEVKQFGFQIVDEFNKLFEIQTYSSGSLIDVISYTPFFGASSNVLFESEQYIDEFRVILKVPTAAFAIDNITLADKNNNGSGPAPIPEPWSLALLGIGLTSMGLARKRKSN